MKALLTHEIGSLAKPSWRTKPMRNIPLEEEDISEMRRWASKLDIEKESLEELEDILRKKRDFLRNEKRKIIYFSSLFATRMLEKAELDLVYDGEQHRVEMYEYPIRRIDGFEFLGHVRSFDNRYYRKAAVTKKPKLKKLFHIEEFKEIASFAEKPIKIPVTGAYTLVDWSFDAYYLSGIEPGEENIGEKMKEARRNFLKDMAEEIIRPNIEALIETGAEYIQLDEPAATTRIEEIDLFVDSVINTLTGLENRAFFSMHICFSDYSLLFPEIEKLEGIVKELHFEYANRDGKELGRSEKKRTGYGILHLFRNNKFIVGLGVIDVHTDFIEPPELIRDRILYAVEMLGDPERIFVAPDCGLRTRTWDVAYEKLRNMVEGKNMAEKELGII